MTSLNLGLKALSTPPPPGRTGIENVKRQTSSVERRASKYSYYGVAYYSTPYTEYGVRVRKNTYRALVLVHPYSVNSHLPVEIGPPCAVTNSSTPPTSTRATWDATCTLSPYHTLGTHMPKNSRRFVYVHVVDPGYAASSPDLIPQGFDDQGV